MRTSKDQLSQICEKAYRYYLNHFGKFIDEPRRIKLVLNSDQDFPSDKVQVPACTSCENEVYIINFNVPVLLTKFSQFINLICWHEVAHVMCDELYRCNPQIKQPRDVNGGHPVLFFKVINTWKDKSLDDIKMQHERHDIPYNYGLSDGFEKGYDPLDELRIMKNRFSYRVNGAFK